MNYKINSLILLVFVSLLAGITHSVWAAPGGIITVTSVADAGTGTLRQAITDANAGDSITFDPALDGMTVLLISQLPTITQTLTIDGSQTPNLQISGSNAVRSGLTLDLAADVTVSGLTFVNGRDESFAGSMLILDGQLTLIDTVISNNYSFNSIIYNMDGTVTLTNSIVSGNEGENKGILHNETGILTLTNSTISDNDTFYGGAIYNESGTVMLNNSTLSENLALLNGGYGGGIYNESGAVSLLDSTVSSNRAVLDGGGIYNETGAFTLVNSTISDNMATLSEGGGIYNETGTIDLTNSTVSGNVGFHGGGIYTESDGTVTLTNTTVTNNTAEAGGGIFVEAEGTVTLNSSLAAGNMIVARYQAQGDFGREIFLTSGNQTTLNSNGHNLVGYEGDAGIHFENGVNNIQPGETPDESLAEIIDSNLEDNGGPTLTHALISGSPAIDHVPSALCSGSPVNGVDQRHVARNADGNSSSSANECDAGAFELSAPIVYTDFIYLPIVLR